MNVRSNYRHPYKRKAEGDLRLRHTGEKAEIGVMQLQVKKFPHLRTSEYIRLHYKKGIKVEFELRLLALKMEEGNTSHGMQKLPFQKLGKARKFSPRTPKEEHCPANTLILAQ